MKILPDETELVGDRVVDGVDRRADVTCERINFLLRHVLEKIAESKEWGAWETLFRDPGDGRLWERTFPQGEMHGGGPPRLKVISEEQARERYDFD